MRTAVVEGIHTDMPSDHHSNIVLERCREIWWTVYVLDCHMCSLLGVPGTLAEQEISAKLPRFASSPQKSLALGIHVKLAKTTALVLQSMCPLLNAKYSLMSRLSCLRQGWSHEQSLPYEHENGAQKPR